jgi:hypothetical protein
MNSDKKEQCIKITLNLTWWIYIALVMLCGMELSYILESNPRPFTVLEG